MKHPAFAREGARLARFAAPSRVALRVAGASALALVLANCASSPKGPGNCAGTRECGAFSHPKYGKASPRVVDVDQDAPKGGGRYQVGKAYTVAGKTYVPREKPVGYTATGNASWYGIAFHGRKTANGEVYDRNSVSAAHPTMPLPSYARVTNTANNHSIVVRVNDRGPYHGGRVMDVSEKTAQMLNFKHMGTARVKIDYLGPASLAGSDDKKLVASLSTNGPAASPLGGTPTMVASAEPVATARPAPLPVRAPTVSSGMNASASSTALGFVAAPQPVPASRAPVDNPGTITNTRFVPVDALPLPPQRPFDLDTIGGAATPAVVDEEDVAQNGRDESLPRARPTDLMFTSMEGGFSRFGKVTLNRMGTLN
jgi:rare lipoprotein A